MIKSYTDPYEFNEAPGQKPNGSVYLGANTSFSGADIRLVLHKYDSGLSIQTKIKETQESIRQAEETLIDLESEISKAEVKLSNCKPGIQKFYIYSSRLDAYNQEWKKYKDSILALNTDVKELMELQPYASTKTLAEASTISISSYREKSPVKALGCIYPKAFVRHTRVIAGSIIFTVFNEHVLYQFLEADGTDFDALQYTSALLDQLPPVDITITFNNEYGHSSRMTLYGVEFVSDGITLSIEDILTENTVNYVARDYDVMRNVGQRKIDRVSNTLQNTMLKKASDLIFEDDFADYKGRSPLDRFNMRRNPFV